MAAPTAPVRPRRRLRTVVGVVLALLLLATVASLPSIRRGLIDPAGRAPQAGVTEVGIRDDFWEYFAFTPSVIEVPAGSTVTWTFASRTEHNVVFDGLASPTQTTGTWSRTFDEPGSYPYLCSLHEGMNGRVEVTG